MSSELVAPGTTFGGRELQQRAGHPLPPRWAGPEPSAEFSDRTVITSARTSKKERT